MTQKAPLSLPPSSVMLGIGLKIASVVVFVAMASLIKGAEGIPPGQLVFFRSFFAIFPILIFLGVRGELRDGFKTRRPLGHLWRGVIGVTAMASGFYGITKLPLPESIVLNYAMPLLIVVFSAVFLHEQVRAYRWSAVAVGMIGVLIIMWPRLTLFSDGFSAADGAALGAMATLVSAAIGACAQLMVRNLVQTERSATIVVFFSMTCSVVALFSIPFGWVWPTPQQTIMLIIAGFAGGVAQILLTECYRHADMSIVAPFEYTSILLGLAIGYIVFGDTPTVQMIIGGMIVVGAGLFIILREHHLGLERRRAKAAEAPPV